MKSFVVNLILISIAIAMVNAAKSVNRCNCIAPIQPKNLNSSKVISHIPWIVQINHNNKTVCTGKFAYLIL